MSGEDRAGVHGDRDGVAIEMSSVSFAYGADAEPVVEGVSLSVARGERLGILGPNGGGKSTLLKILLGDLSPRSGSVRVLGEPPVRARERGLIGYLPQRVTAELGFPLSARQVVEQGVSMGLRPWRGLSPERRRQSSRALELVGAGELADRPVGRLSGGQLQRVLIARAVASGPAVLLLDEPTVGIDVSGQTRFGQMLETLRADLGLTVVIVSHELATIAATSDRVACLRRTLHFHDAPHGLTPGVLAEVFSHDVAILKKPSTGRSDERRPGEGDAGCGCCGGGA